VSRNAAAFTEAREGGAFPYFLVGQYFWKYF
jgi:hypothetical protein